MIGLPSRFDTATRAWLEARFEAPTPVQLAGWPLLAARKHALLIAPTGSGKTLAAFLESIDRLGRLPADSEAGVRVLYVSPLKALVYDIERNLRAPLAGIAAEAASAGDPDRFRVPRIAVRTGDSSARDRRQQARDPAEILVTTPESLYLILGSQQRETLRSVETIIVDEIHALAPTKRGVHLGLSLERVARNATAGDPQRIGLSATARPASKIARFLGGDREVEIVDTSAAPSIELRISVPVPDMTRPEVGRRSKPATTDGETGESDRSLWPAIYPELLDAIRAHKSSILFVNSRGLCERIAQRLNEIAGEPLVRAHHGSLAHEKRREIEAALASGKLRAIVATSSLELGIDMAAVELVMLVESPGAIGRGLQRIGRAGHAVGATSRGIVFPKHRGDLLEATVVAIGMRRGEVEAIEVPSQCLDVLAQQIVAITSEAPIHVDELAAILGRTASFAKLPRGLLESVLDMLAGRYPSTDFAELRPRILWDREANLLEAREGAGRVALLSGGTIPDRGQYAVHLGTEGPRIGELDEEMVHETQPGDVVTLGASSWRAIEITRDRVLVAPAPGEVGRLPFWRGDGPGRPIELGRALGRFTRELAAHDSPRDWLVEEHGLDDFAARNLVDYIEEQIEWTGVCPSDERITIERYRDEVGDWRLCILTPFGSRIHAPWTLAIASQLAERGEFDAQPLWTDDGIMFRFADADRLPAASFFLPDPDELEERIVSQLGSSSLFASQFRENAARALLLPRRRPGTRTPLWAQRLRAQNLQAVARGFPDFPIMLETYRSCIQDVFDVPGLTALMRDVRSRAIGIDDVETPSASPFARSLVFAYTATYLYQLDMPVAERRTQALSLDRHMLRELLGAEALRELLDVEIIDRVEARLQGRDPERRARHKDGLHDLLRSIGDLDETALLDRFEGEPTQLDSALAELAASRRAARVEIAGELRWIAAEDGALYRDALGVEPPAELPDAFLEPQSAPLEQLLMRFARTHAPFTSSQMAARFGLLPAQIEPVLESLAARGSLVAGEFDPRGQGSEWCEPDVLRRIKRATLNRLREEISPVSGEVLSRFLLDWHGIGVGRAGSARLDEVIDLLEGLPISFAELERSILPARVANYAPSMLDALGAQGQLVWVGHAAIGEKDGRVALYRRERISTLLDPPAETPELSPTQAAIHDQLERRGAAFFSELIAALGAEGSESLFEALWQLVWLGLVTNDTFAPLRALQSRPPPQRRRGRPMPVAGARRAAALRAGTTARSAAATAGRWSLVAPLFVAAPSPTERLHAKTLLYLDRHGVVSRNSMQNETLVGGFGAVYPMLRELEESGRIRRGHFVEGMSSAQFAVAGAVDRLRSQRGVGDRPSGVRLAATDPAQLFGSVLDWPPTRRDLGRPRRAVGAAVVLVDGTPSLFIDGGGERVLCFEDEASRIGRARIDVALQAWIAASSRTGAGRIRVEEVDGESARSSPLAEAFVRAGFRAGYRGFEWDRMGSGNADSAIALVVEDDSLGAHEEGREHGDG